MPRPVGSTPTAWLWEMLSAGLVLYHHAGMACAVCVNIDFSLCCWVFNTVRRQARGWPVSSIVHPGVVDDTPAVAIRQNHEANANRSIGFSLATCTSPARNLPAAIPGPEQLGRLEAV
jgi:hypothetical protein